MKKNSIFISFLILIIHFTLVYAQSNTNKSISIGAGIGANIPSGDFANKSIGAAKLGIVFTSKGMIQIHNNFAFYFGYNFRKFEAEINTTDLETYWRLNDYELGARLCFNSQYIPYIEIVTGIYNATSYTKGYLTKSLTRWYQAEIEKISINSEKSGDNNFGLNIGVGKKFHFNKLLDIDFTIKYNHFIDKKYEPISFDIFTAYCTLLIPVFHF